MKDLVCLDDLDEFASETDEDEFEIGDDEYKLLAQDVKHRLFEEYGSNPDDEDRGAGLLDLLSGTDSPAKIARIIEADLVKDDRVLSCIATVQTTGLGNEGVVSAVDIEITTVHGLLKLHFTAEDAPAAPTGGGGDDGGGDDGGGDPPGDPPGVKTFRWFTSYPGGQRSVTARSTFSHPWQLTDYTDAYIGSQEGWVDGAVVSTTLPPLTDTPVFIASPLLGVYPGGVTITCTTDHVFSDVEGYSSPAPPGSGGQSARVVVSLKRASDSYSAPSWQRGFNFDVSNQSPTPLVDSYTDLSGFDFQAGDLLWVSSQFIDLNKDEVEGFQSAPFGPSGGAAVIPASSGNFVLTITGTR